MFSRVPSLSGLLESNGNDNDNFNGETFKIDESIEFYDEQTESSDNYRLKRSIAEFFGANKTREFNPSVDLSSSLYCSIVNEIPLKCMQLNILDVFKANFSNLTKNDVIGIVQNFTR